MLAEARVAARARVILFFISSIMKFVCKGRTKYRHGEIKSYKKTA
jgi:hypothetical protein